jgi:hypothetical protein
LYRYLLGDLLAALVREISPGASFLYFLDILNASDTIPLIQMATFNPFGASVGRGSFGSFFFRFWWFELPRYIPPYTDGYFWAFWRFWWGRPLREIFFQVLVIWTPQVESPLYRWLLLRLLGVLVGEDLSERLQSIMLRPGYKQSVHLTIKCIK